MKKQKIILIITISILFILPSFTGCLEGEKKVTIIGTNQQFKTISEAISNAKDGDTILVKDGVYQESLHINKALTIKGNNKDNTILQGNKTGDVITIIVDNVTIMNFTIKNAGNSTYPLVDAGIDIQSGSNLIDNVIITKNNYGINMDSQDKVRIENSIIKDNYNRGINLYQCSNITINNDAISNNSYGIYFSYVINSFVTNTSISEHDGRGLYLGSLSNFNLISGNSVTDNHYGIHVKGSLNNTFKNNLFMTNVRALYLCCGGEDNLIYLNVFLLNDENAYGYPVNQFDNGTIGNYWDDYNGTDSDNDGIGDTPYNATIGESYGISNLDRYPLMSPSR